MGSGIASELAAMAEAATSAQHIPGAILYFIGPLMFACCLMLSWKCFRCFASRNCKELTVVGIDLGDSRDAFPVVAFTSCDGENKMCKMGTASFDTGARLRGFVGAKGQHCLPVQAPCIAYAGLLALLLSSLAGIYQIFLYDSAPFIHIAISSLVLLIMFSALYTALSWLIRLDSKLAKKFGRGHGGANATRVCTLEEALKSEGNAILLKNTIKRRKFIGGALVLMAAFAAMVETADILGYLASKDASVQVMESRQASPGAIQEFVIGQWQAPDAPEAIKIKASFFASEYPRPQLAHGQIIQVKVNEKALSEGRATMSGLITTAATPVVWVLIKLSMIAGISAIALAGAAIFPKTAFSSEEGSQ